MQVAYWMDMFCKPLGFGCMEMKMVFGEDQDASGRWRRIQADARLEAPSAWHNAHPARTETVLTSSCHVVISPANSHWPTGASDAHIPLAHSLRGPYAALHQRSPLHHKFLDVRKLIKVNARKQLSSQLLWLVCGISKQTWPLIA